jgi:multidrug resistance efflux pump
MLRIAPPLLPCRCLPVALTRAQIRAPFDGKIISLNTRLLDTIDNVKVKIDNVETKIDNVKAKIDNVKAKTQDEGD